MIEEFNFKLKPAQAMVIYDLLLQTRNKLKISNDKWYKTYDQILSDIELQYPGLKEYRSINSED